MSKSEWLSVQEAARELGVNDSRVRQLCRDGELDARKVGTVWIVDAASVKERAKNPPPRGRRW